MKLILKAARQSCVRLGRDENGAAFLVTLGVFMFMFLLCSGVYAIGDMVRQRIELQNAADAAAYSAAVIQADTISRVATINRAMAWTYLQLTRRQMDYIVDKWVGLTKTRMEEDRAKMRSFHQVIAGPCVPGQHYRGPDAETWWCGFLGQDKLFAMNDESSFPIPNNIDSAIPPARFVFSTAHLIGQRGSGNPMCELIPALEPQIVCDKANILAMNMALIDTVIKLPGKIDEAVPNILKANLPERLVNAGDFQYYIYQNKTPLSNFLFLNNKKEDERRFLAFAGPHYDREVRKTFNKKQDRAEYVGGSGAKAGGVNHWFVRHNGARRANSSDTGIQRAYLFGPSGNASAYQDKPSLSLTVPSCKNNDADNDSSPIKTSALVSEWHWSATKWLCFVIPPPFYKEVHIALFSAMSCDHCKGGSTINKPRNNCTWPVADGNHGLPHPVLGLPLAGGGRAYGDDPELLSGGNKETYYTGALCNPLILSKSFFGKEGSLVVGVSRKCKNPWDEIFGTISQGLYKAFNPTVKSMWAVSAARAGYRDPAYFGTGHYQIAYTDPAPLSSSSSPEQLKKNWNLKETDWDAVFLPVKDAWKLCMGNNNNVESPGAFTMGLGSSDVLGTIMTEQWKGLNGGSTPGFGTVSAPYRMSGNLDWSGLSEKLAH